MHLISDQIFCTVDDFAQSSIFYLLLQDLKRYACCLADRSDADFPVLDSPVLQLFGVDLVRDLIDPPRLLISDFEQCPDVFDT